MAREYGVDITEIPIGDPQGRVSAQDILSFVQGGSTGSARSAAADDKLEGLERGSDSHGTFALEPMNAVRKKTAQHMTRAWTTIPHVTHFEKADITGLELLRKKYAAKLRESGAKLTTMSFIIKVAAEALKRFPKFNATVDMENEQLVLKQYCNIGIAMDTPRGLVVPSLKGTANMSITQISEELGELADKARNIKLTMDDLQGGTFTISNLGGLGVSQFAPLINAPEVAILGVSRAKVEPVFQNGQCVPRTMMPLSISYDHRVIDGADAARFMAWFIDTLENPWTLFIEE
jgi:pyruvate dehydrogenase E2 component (dihydrolipoamide acetyltransferase)